MESSRRIGMLREVGSILLEGSYFRYPYSRMSLNPFLDRFIKAQVIQTTVPQQEEPAKRDHKGRKKSKHGTADGRAPFGEEDAFTRLCTEKPHRREVLAYFRQRISELVAADMD